MTKTPRKGGVGLPRYLAEPEYRCLEKTVFESTQADTYSACFDWAWFLTLTRTGMLLSVLLAVGPDDLDLITERAIARLEGLAVDE